MKKTTDRLIFSELLLRLEPVLNRVAVAAISFLIDVIGRCGDLRPIKVQRFVVQQWGFRRIKDPIVEQFYAVIEKA